MIEFAISIIPLIYLLFKEYFSAEARAREDKRQFIIDQASLKVVVDAAMQKWLGQVAQKSKQAASAWDIADQDAMKDSEKK